MSNPYGEVVYECEKCYNRITEDSMGPYETAEGNYICEDCYQDGVSAAEYAREGDR